MDVLKRLKSYDIILASRSPRRKALLEGAGIPFRTMVRAIDETYPGEMEPDEVVKFLCRKKADQFADVLQKPAVVLITADTIVVHNEKIINKPKDASHAFDMLSVLSGSAHEVYTGVCIRHGKSENVFVDHSLVRFRDLAKEEIHYYIDSFAPYDKAGAYGIQEWIGYIGISGIEGSYHNVMGLPVHLVYASLTERLCRHPSALHQKEQP